MNKMISLGGMEFLVISLNQPLSENTEVFPGDPKPQKEIFSSLKDSGYEHYIWKVSDHHFHPHGDAPNHQSDDSRGIESYGLEFQFNSACIIDLSECLDAKEIDGIKFLTEIKKEHLEPHNKIIAGNGAVIIRTGYDKWLEANKKHDPDKIPHFTKEAVDYINQFNLKVIGTDSLTIDPMGEHYAHQVFKEKLIVEGLVNLYSIPQQEFDLQTAPIVIKGATGGPIAAYAFINANVVSIGV